VFGFFGSGPADAGSREAPRVVKRRDLNGATRPHRLENAVALTWFVRIAHHMVMVNDGDCAPRLATPIASLAFSG
jgi:hypothetical protein